MVDGISIDEAFQRLILFCRVTQMTDLENLLTGSWDVKTYLSAVEKRAQGELQLLQSKMAQLQAALASQQFNSMQKQAWNIAAADIRGNIKGHQHVLAVVAAERKRRGL